MTEDAGTYDKLAQSILGQKDTALLVVDVQSRFCDPNYPEPWPKGNKETASISRRIERLSHEFRKAAVPLFAIYFSATDDDRDFYEFHPQSKDMLVRKTKTSAFKCEHAQFENLLKANGINNILVCGFNLCACVKATAIDGQKKGFQTYLLEDLSGEGGDAHIHNYKSLAKKSMSKAGVEIISARELISHISKGL